MYTLKRPPGRSTVISRRLHVPTIGSPKRELNVYEPVGIVTGFNGASSYNSLTFFVTSIDERSVP